jgi:hypothetical protein
MHKQTRVRSAVTGEFVKKEEAVKHPKTTVKETVKSTKPAAKGKAK